ncbi:MAG: hypothetical protein JWR57_1253 [Mycetocola sp.]|jgi:capsular polysaccharide biosynthesis protein|nr:hypothetical protein [Mycetocola sp.]
MDVRNGHFYSNVSSSLEAGPDPCPVKWRHLLSQNDSTSSLGIEQYSFVLRRQWRVIAAAAAIGLACAIAFLLVVPETTTATTELNISVISTEPFNADRSASGLLDDATEAQIASSYVVASKAAESLGGKISANDIRERAQVATTAGTSVVRVSFTDENAEEAVRGADAVAAAYLDYRSEQATERIQATLDRLADRREELRAQLGTANAATASAPPGSVEAAQAESDRQQITLELEALLTQKNTLESVDTVGGVVLTPAGENPIYANPTRRTVLATGLLAGGVVGVLAAFVVNRRDRRLRSALEVSRLTGAPVLAVLDENAAKIPADGDDADQLRVARERIFSGTAPDARSLLIIDDSGLSDIATGAINLAIVAAQAEHLIELIVPSLTDDQLAAMGESLSLHRAQVADGVREVYASRRVPTLTVFVPGDVDDTEQSDLLITRHVRHTIASPAARTYYILVLKSDSHHSSLLAGLRLADNSLILARAGASRSDSLSVILAETEELGAPLIGSIVLEPKGKR